MLLNEWAEPDAALDGLDDMIRRFQGVPAASARPGDWQVAQNSYLQVVETVERVLPSLFEDDDGMAAGMFGDHYRLIRDMSPSTPRPAPLIEDEAGRQVRALQRLRDRVERLKALRNRAGLPVVLDTNVLMHYRRPDEVPWAEVLGSGRVRLILPGCVIDELDNKKYTGSDRMSHRADLAIRALREHSADLRPGSAASFPDGTTLEVFPDEPGHVRKANPDEELLSRVTLLRRAIGQRVTVVTGDLSMQLRAKAGGLPYAVMPGKYAKDAARRAAAGDGEPAD
jgi:rRNA-processing protein FCF1